MAEHPHPKHPCLDSQLSLYQHHNAKAKGLRPLVMLTVCRFLSFCGLSTVCILADFSHRSPFSYTEEDRRSKSILLNGDNEMKGFSRSSNLMLSFLVQDISKTKDLCSSWLFTMIYFLHDNLHDLISGPAWILRLPCSVPQCQMTDRSGIKYLSPKNYIWNLYDG